MNCLLINWAEEFVPESSKLKASNVCLWPTWLCGRVSLNWTCGRVSLNILLATGNVQTSLIRQLLTDGLYFFQIYTFKLFNRPSHSFSGNFWATLYTRVKYAIIRSMVFGFNSSEISHTIADMLFVSIRLIAVSLSQIIILCRIVNFITGY